MSPDVRDKPITAEELARNHPDGPCELVLGRIVLMSPAGVLHTIVVGRINMLLVPFVAEKNLGLVTSGEGGYRLHRDPDTVRAPDLAFVSHETIVRSQRSGETYFPCAPDLAVEVLSPDDKMQDVEAKVREYLDAGSKLVWVASPSAELVYVHEPGVPGRVLGRGAELDGGRVLPGFRAPVSLFFAPPGPATVEA